MRATECVVERESTVKYSDSDLIPPDEFDPEPITVRIPYETMRQLVNSGVRS